MPVSATLTKFTDEDFRLYPAVFGSFSNYTIVSEYRAKIEINVKFKKGATVKFLGDLDKYRWSVCETYSLSNHYSGSFIDTGWNRTWVDETSTYTTTLDEGYLVLCVNIINRDGKETKFTEEDLSTLHNLFEVKGWYYL